jgi:hypothetical protein
MNKSNRRFGFLIITNLLHAMMFSRDMAQSMLHAHCCLFMMFRLIRSICADLTECDTLALSLNVSDPIEFAAYQAICSIVNPPTPAQLLCPCSAIVTDAIYSRPHCKELADQNCLCTVNTYKLNVGHGNEACVQCPAPKFSPKTGVVFSVFDINLLFCGSCPKNSKYSSNYTEQSPCRCSPGYEGLECQPCMVGRITASFCPRIPRHPHAHAHSTPPPRRTTLHHNFRFIE